MLAAQGITRRFGGLLALSDVSFATQPGEIFGLIGPNGAGKTTMLNILAGAMPPSSGQVVFGGRDISRLSASQRARLGIGRTFQSAFTFKTQPVAENIRRGYLLKRRGLPLHLLGRGAPMQGGSEAGTIEEVAGFVGLREHLATSAGSLPYGLQKLVGLAIALAAGPSLLLMDEPAAGLNPAETQNLTRLIEALRRERGLTVVLVEHDMKLVMQVCDRILVLNYGRQICMDTPAGVRADAGVVEAYLGAEYEFA